MAIGGIRGQVGSSIGRHTTALAAPSFNWTPEKTATVLLGSFAFNLYPVGLVEFEFRAADLCLQSAVIGQQK